MYIAVMKLSDQPSDVFTALADPTRREMLLRLAREGERNVTQLMEPFAISQPAVSKHLRVLHEAGLVRRRKEGRQHLYDIEASRLDEVRDWIAQVELYWDQRLDALGAYLDKKKQHRRKPN